MRAPTDVGDLKCETLPNVASGGSVTPEAWAWTPWQYADSGHFSGRWMTRTESGAASTWGRPRWLAT